VTGHLRALVPGDRPQQARRQVTHPVFQRIVEGVAVAPGKMKQPDQAGLSFDEGAYRRPLALADDEIPFPMPGLGTVLGQERALMDREHRLL
jgi:hypothetical protein